MAVQGNMMKRNIRILCLIFLTVLTSCKENMNREGYDGGICTPNIMVNDRHYHTTGETDNKDHFEADGTITSSVSESEIPHENNQSNFGAGYEYDIISDSIVYVCIDDKWIKYEYYVPDNQ